MPQKLIDVYRDINSPVSRTSTLKSCLNWKKVEKRKMCFRCTHNATCSTDLHTTKASIRQWRYIFGKYRFRKIEVYEKLYSVYGGNTYVRIRIVLPWTQLDKYFGNELICNPSATVVFGKATTTVDLKRYNEETTELNAEELHSPANIVTIREVVDNIFTQLASCTSTYFLP